MSDISLTPLINAFVDGPIGWLEFARPEARNAISAQMWEAIPVIMEKFQNSAEIRAIVITGQGTDAFSAGADISEFSANRSSSAAAEQYEKINVDAFNAIARAKIPTIAMISGFCMGGGLAVALSCDIRIAAENAIFSLPPAKLGLAYPIQGIAQLLSVVSPAIAKEMIFTAKRLNVLDASRSGLINEVTTLDQLETVVKDLCQTIAQNAPLTIQASKAMIDELHANPENPDMKKLLAASRKCFNSKDYAEGQNAFAQKRKPVFTGE